MTPEKFFNDYLRSKVVFTNSVKGKEKFRSLIRDFQKLTENDDRSILEIIPPNNIDQRNRLALLSDLIETKRITPEVFLEQGTNLGVLKSTPTLEDFTDSLGKFEYTKDMKSYEEGLKERLEGLEKPTLENPTTPKVTAVSVTPRGGQKKMLRTPRDKPPPELGRQPTSREEADLSAALAEEEPKIARRGGLRGGRKITDLQKKSTEERTKAQQEATARGEGAGMEDPAPVARPPEPLAMTEPDPTPVEVATGKVESGENNDPIADLEPPTFSPDEMNPPSIDMEIERQAQLAASSMRQGQRPAPAPAPAPVAEKQGDIQGTREGQPITETKAKTGLEDIPNKTDLIPKERLSADFKNESELISDIDYFFKRFPNELKDIKKSYDSFPNKTLPYYKRTHRQIVARLQAGKGEKKKIGVIIEGEEFIKQKLKEVILEMRAEGLTNEDLLVDVEGDEETLRNDFGNYEVVVGESGLLHSQREPVYRYIPQTKKTIVPAEKVLEDKSKRVRTQNLPTRFRSVFTHNAIRNQNNPFTKPTSQIKLKYLY